MRDIALFGRREREKNNYHTRLLFLRVACVLPRVLADRTRISISIIRFARRVGSS